MVVMLLGGLWHGASWRFVVWGGLHGLYLAIERLVRFLWRGRPAISSAPARIGLALLTFMLVCVAWVFFRAQDFSGALRILAAMFSGGIGTLVFGRVKTTVVLAVTVGLLCGSWVLRESSLENAVERVPWWLRSMALAAMLVSLALAPGDDRAFIYFQF